VADRKAAGFTQDSCKQRNGKDFRVGKSKFVPSERDDNCK